MWVLKFFEDSDLDRSVIFFEEFFDIWVGFKEVFVINRFFKISSFRGFRDFVLSFFGFLGDVF